MKIGKILIIICLAIITFSSCKKVGEDIVGTWNFQTFDSRPQGTIIWTFKDNGELIRVLSYEGGISFDSCNYVVDKSLFTTRISVSGSEPMWSPQGGLEHINGSYRIDALKNDVLNMTRFELENEETAGAYLRCEMIRKQ